jgi:hypothetical protein
LRLTDEQRKALGVVTERVALSKVSSGVRIVIDGVPLGPVMTKRAASVVARWLEGGALAELDGESGSKLQRTLEHVDRAADSVLDLLKNGLR